MINKINPEYINNIGKFSWYENVAVEDDVIVYRDINFENEIIISDNNTLQYNNEVFKYNNLIPNQNKNKAIQKDQIKFCNCKFSTLKIKSTSERTKKIDIIGGEIGGLIISDCEIFEKFYVNKQYGGNKKPITIKKLIIKDAIFHENFKLHNAEISEISIEDTDFEKHADFFKSKISKVNYKDASEHSQGNEICFKAINFKGLALFGDTEFNKKLIFKYVTFESFSHFRKAKLPCGLDLDYSNIQNEMNFFDVHGLDAKEAKNNTSQETYRIIKHNFERIGNKIEANKYLALELERKKVNLESDEPRKWLDYLVFKIHWLSSEFGTNWFRVLILICFASLMTVAFIHFDLLKHVLFNPCLFKSEYMMKIINEFFQYLYILNKNEELKSHPATLLFNKIVLGYLYYQFLISTRKDTRR